MYGSGREFGFQLLEGNASGKLDLLHTAPPPFRVVLFLPRCFLQDPIFIEFSETILTLFWGDMWWESAYNGCCSFHWYSSVSESLRNSSREYGCCGDSRPVGSRSW